ncbi:MAG: hypothetical protein JXA13_08600 [Anaerolineales bacterium]|nr:hypothetical protein [Anaerolineales bacterium]
MNIRCIYCQNMFVISRDEILSALPDMIAENHQHYNAHCPRCGRANRIARKQLEHTTPGWQNTIGQVRKAVPEKPTKAPAKAKPAPKKPTGKKPAAKKATTPTKASAKPAAKKTAVPSKAKAKPAAVKKTAPSKAAAKPAAKKSAAPSKAAAKPAAKKAAAKKTTAKKTPKK